MKFLRDRRSFLQASSMAVAGGSLCTPAFSSNLPFAASDQGAVPIQLGLASYTFRSFTRERLIEAMKQLRLTALNAKDVKDQLPSTSAEAEQQATEDYHAAAIKLTAVGTIYFLKDEDADIREKFEYAKRAGVRVLVAGDPLPAVLPRIEKFVKEYDIRLAIHNHGPEDKIFPSPLEVLRAVKNLDERMGCCIDVGHTMRAGVDVVRAIHEVGPRLFDVHMKDLAKADDKESQVAVGQGIMPVREIFRALVETKYRGFVDLEYEIHAEDPLPGVIESFAYMRGVLAGMQ